MLHTPQGLSLGDTNQKWHTGDDDLAEVHALLKTMEFTRHCYFYNANNIGN